MSSDRLEPREVCISLSIKYLFSTKGVLFQDDLLYVSQSSSLTVSPHFFSSSLTIPTPSNQVPQTVAPSGSGSTSRSKKAKPIEPSKVLTAQCVTFHFRYMTSLTRRLGIFLQLTTSRTTLIRRQSSSSKSLIHLTRLRERYSIDYIIMIILRQLFSRNTPHLPS